MRRSHGRGQRSDSSELDLANQLHEVAERLAAVDGVVGVVLGGSRARGDARPDSDYDLGVYYHHPLDIVGLQRLADDVADTPAAVTAPGEWGPWVDGGAWLTIDGAAVDWIYRDLDRVLGVWADCRAGVYEVAAQAGHPLGFFSFAYAGELALAQLLADPSAALAALQGEVQQFPPRLADAIVDHARWEVPFTLSTAAKGAARGDVVYVSGCLFRVVGLLCHAIHARAERWLLNEKGAVAAAARLPSAPPSFEARATDLFRQELGAALTDASALAADALQ